MKTKTISVLVLAALTLVACEKQSIETSVTEALPASPLEKFFTEEEITAGEPISVIRATAKPGDEISISGLVMGREKVFVDGRASFILGDPTTITPCNKMPDDHCATPWDACCDSKEVLRKGIASIQILGEEGRVLSGTIKGTKGLKELSTVSVSGTVAEQSTADALIVNATRIHVSEP